MIVVSAHGLRRDLAPRHEPPWGACLHTTGRGLADMVRKRTGRQLATSEEVLDEAQRVYASGFGPGYVVGCAGTTVQIAADDRIAQHVGGSRRLDYLSGAWIDQLPISVVQLWRGRWPGKASPQHLFPGKSANAAYIGIEMTPITGVSDAIPAGEGERFTAAQYRAVDALLDELALRHGWPVGWRTTSRLVGHEDVGLLDRHDERGGWDPGALRPEPFWRWERLA